MIRASLIYVAVTVLLAFVDSIRIRKAKGIVENINHRVSAILAGVGAGLVIAFSIPGPVNGTLLLQMLFFIAAFTAVRLVVYDGALNLCRRLRIDYESPSTSSYEDQHTNHLSFWAKRALALAGWFVCWIVYYLIFEKK